MRTVAVIGFSVVVMTIWSGCREREPEPALNYNLGDKPGELMPLAVAAGDARILEDQKGVREEEAGRPARRARAARSPADQAEPKDSGAKSQTKAPAGKDPAADKKAGAAALKGASLEDLLKRSDKKGAKPSTPDAKAGRAAPKGASLGDLLKRASKKGPKLPATDEKAEPTAPKARAPAGLAKKETQEGASPETAKAEQFVRKLADGRFDEAVKDFDSRMQEAIPSAKLKAMWEGAIGQCGPFKAMEPGTTQRMGALTAVLVPCRFAIMSLQLRLVYDPKGKISGLWVEPLGAETAGESAPDKPAGKGPKASEGSLLGNLLKQAIKKGVKSAATKPAAKPTATRPSSPPR
jgi:hypothetical protein